MTGLANTWNWLIFAGSAFGKSVTKVECKLAIDFLPPELTCRWETKLQLGLNEKSWLKEIFGMP